VTKKKQGLDFELQNLSNRYTSGLLDLEDAVDWKYMGYDDGRYIPEGYDYHKLKGKGALHSTDIKDLIKSKIPPLTAYCASSICAKFFNGTVKCYKPIEKIESEYNPKQNDCPDCGHALIWKRNPRIAKKKKR
jgi:DNA-directed RNA polymerase subunit RPC12/RpoP